MNKNIGKINMKLIILVSYNWGANEAKYAYDEAGQLIREDNQGLGKSWTWAYDLGGYILEKRNVRIPSVNWVKRRMRSPTDMVH